MEQYPLLPIVIGTDRKMFEMFEMFEMLEGFDGFECLKNVVKSDK